MRLTAVPRFLQSTVFGRQIVLSYPKSGRTWILNIFANYLARVRDHIESPLPFIVRVEGPRLERLWRKTGLLFSHGNRVREIQNGMPLQIDSVNLRYSKVTFLTRNPVSVLLSLYHHMISKAALAERDFRTFALGTRGSDALAHYYNQVVPILSQNKRARFVAYENLHSGAPDRMKSLFDLTAHHFGSLDEGALRWAIEVCEFSELKKRANEARSARRVRQGNVSPKGPEIDSDLAAEIRATFDAKLESNVREIIQRRSSWFTERTIKERNF